MQKSRCIELKFTATFVVNIMAMIQTLDLSGLGASALSVKNK